MPNRDKASTPRARLVLSATTDQGVYDGTGPYDASLEKKVSVYDGLTLTLTLTLTLRKARLLA